MDAGTGIHLFTHELRPAAREPEGAIVLFHGRGTDERDLFPLLDALDPDRRHIGVTPRGPVTLPPGGAHWYIVRRVGYPDQETFLASFARACAWLDSLPGALGVPLANTVVGGFSQGAVIGYALGLARGRPRPAGILALSGFLPVVDGFELDLDDLRGLPVAIGHGSLDPVIPVDFSRSARQRLEAAGAAVTYGESPMGHGVDPAFLTRVARWTGAVIARSRAQAPSGT